MRALQRLSIAAFSTLIVWSVPEARAQNLNRDYALTEEFAELNAKLTENVIHSSAGKQLGATLRLGNNRGFKAGSQAAAMFAAINAGKEVYSYKDKRYIVYIPARWKTIMTAGGIDARYATDIYSQKEANEIELAANPLACAAARKLQSRVDWLPRFQKCFALKIAKHAGIKNDKENAKANALGESLALALLGLNTDDPPEKQLDKDTQVDPALRMAFLTDFLVEISPKVHVKMPWEKARDSVFMALGDLEGHAKRAGFDNLQHLLAMNDKAARERIDAIAAGE